MPKVVPFCNHKYFQSLKEEMERTNKYMIIDGAGILWHKDDLSPILEQYQQREAVNNN